MLPHPHNGVLTSEVLCRTQTKGCPVRESLTSKTTQEVTLITSGKGEKEMKNDLSE